MEQFVPPDDNGGDMTPCFKESLPALRYCGGR